MGAEEVNIKGDEEKVTACGLSCIKRHIYQHSDISTYIVTFRRTWWHFRQHSVISINMVTFLKQSGTETFFVHCTAYRYTLGDYLLLCNIEHQQLKLICPVAS